MIQITLEGSYYQIGLQVGKMLKGNLKLPEAAPSRLEWASNCEKAMEQYTPGLLEELQGLADGANLKREKLSGILLYEPFAIKRFVKNLPSTQRCTIFVIPGSQTATKQSIFARNYDWYTEASDYFMINRLCPTGKVQSILFTDHYVGGFGGISAAGLACGVTGMPFFNGQFQPGILLNMMTRWILDSCHQVEEAVAFLETAPHCEGNLYMLADKAGTIACVEACPNKVNTTYAQEDELLVATNHFQTEEMQGLQREIPDTIEETTFTRLKGVKAWYNGQKRPIAIEAVKMILKDHKNAVCDHERTGGTVWSWIAPLGANTVEVCVGQPCQSEYRPYLIVGF
ncbi:MAG: C45 family autoproteolytic acyltransferase/hydrolase [Candidatus Thorarchaeota archaeon]